MTASVKVPLPEWRAALKPFLKTKAPKRGESGEVRLTLEKGHLVFRYCGVETHAQAEGDWLGAASVDWSYISRSAKIPPLKDPVTVSVDGERLKIEGSICPCIWTPALAGTLPAFKNEPSPSKRGQDTTFITPVSMSLDYSDEKVASLGLTAQVAKAKHQKEQMISDAARILAPLEITADDLTMLVKKTLGYKMKR